MRITERTKYSDFEPLESSVTAAGVEQIKQAAERLFGRCYDLTVDKFFGLIAGNYSLLGDLREPTVLQIYWLKRFSEDFLPAFQKAIERYRVQPNEREREAQNGTFDLSMQEGMLVFLRDYFGLMSFADAGKLTLGEYFLALKHRYNTDTVQRNYDRIMRREMKLKK